MSENIKKEIVSLTFVNTKKDLWNFRLFIFLKNLWIRLLILIFLMIGIMFLFFTSKIFSFEYWFVSFVLAFIYIILVRILVWLRLGIEKKFFIKKTIIFEESKVNLDFEFEKLETNWTYFDKMEQNKSYIFLYISKMSVIIIPKNTFGTQLETFYKLAKLNNLG